VAFDAFEKSCDGGVSFAAVSTGYNRLEIEPLLVGDLDSEPTDAGPDRLGERSLEGLNFLGET